MTRYASLVAGLALALASVVAATTPADAALPTRQAGGCDGSRISADRPVVFRTLPVVSGFRFDVDGRVAVTGADGTVTLTGVASCDLADRLTVAEDDRVVGLDIATRARFSRWFGGTASGFTAAFDLEHAGQFQFLDGLGEPYPPDGIQTLRVKSSTGNLAEVDPAGTSWFTGSRVILTAEGLVSKDVYYTVDSVLVDGAEVVNRSQYKWFPLREPPPTVTLLFFTAEISVRDAFFGFPVGSAVEMTDANGAVRTLTLDGGARATVHNLPRGDYELLAKGPGMKMPTPVSLTRDQVVDLKLFTWLDVGVLMAGPLVVAVALFLLGRRRRRRRHARSPQDQPGEPTGADTSRPAAVTA